jgi:valyl-tRNA synthetase
MTKHFDYSQREQEIYAQWESSGAFKPSGQGMPYFIPMPPPNITGQLHTGHAIGTTLQDILARYHRMQGDDTIYLPGYDHAGLGAQSKILEAMAQTGIENPTQEQFDEFAAEWTNSTRERITEQLKRLGASADWDLARYTLDEHYQEATAEAFRQLYQAELIYYNNDDGQWYLKLSELATPFIEALDRGEMKIYPAAAEKRLRQTPDGEPLEQARDWCISRQSLWGHQIPMWKYSKPGYEIWSSKKLSPPQTIAALGGHITDWEIAQSPDRLDTWFSSALWTFAALGWPDQTPQLDQYFPAAILETGWDISFFWAAKMSMMSLALTGELPFKELYLHGLIRDKDGQKMSKSLGNGMNPLTLADEYGTDALRWALAAYQEPGRDRGIHADQLETGRRMATKLWNIGKFMKNDPLGIIADPAGDNRAWDWAYEELEETQIQYNFALDANDFSGAAQILRSFTFEIFSSRLIPAAQAEPGLEATQALRDIYAQLLKLAHPFMPFISEELWSSLALGQGMLINQRFNHPMSHLQTRARMDAHLHDLEAQGELINAASDRLISQARTPLADTEKPWELEMKTQKWSVSQVFEEKTYDEALERYRQLLKFSADGLSYDLRRDFELTSPDGTVSTLAPYRPLASVDDEPMGNPWDLPSEGDQGETRVVKSLDELAYAIDDDYWLDELLGKTVASISLASRKRQLELAIQEFGIEALDLDLRDQFGIEFDFTPPAIVAEYEEESEPTDYRLSSNHQYAYVAVAPLSPNDGDGFTVTIKREDDGVVVDITSRLTGDEIVATWASWSEVSNEHL